MKRRDCLVLAVMPLLSGCGFHLRGQLDLSEFMQRIYLLTTLPDDDFLLMAIKSALHSADAQLFDEEEKDKANIILRVDNNVFSRRTVAKFGDGKMREDELRQSAHFNVYRRDDSSLLGATVLRSVRSVQVDDTQFLGSTESEEVARRGLARDIADSMVRFLAKISERE